MNYYESSKTFGGVFSRDNIPKLKESFYILNLDDESGPGTHWTVVYNVGSECVYFDSFGVDPPEEALSRMRVTGKSMSANTYRIQDLNSINCGFFCMYVIDELQRGRSYIKILTDFDASDFKKNDILISTYV